MIYVLVSGCAVLAIIKYVSFLKQIRKAKEYARELENRCEYLQNLLTGSATERICKQREWYEVFNNRK